MGLNINALSFKGTAEFNKLNTTRKTDKQDAPIIGLYNSLLLFEKEAQTDRLEIIKGRKKAGIKDVAKNAEVIGNLKLLYRLAFSDNQEKMQQVKPDIKKGDTFEAKVDGGVISVTVKDRDDGKQKFKWNLDAKEEAGGKFSQFIPITKLLVKKIELTKELLSIQQQLKDVDAEIAKI